MIIDHIERMFKSAFEKEWYETYWCIDLHGTVIKPTYKGVSMEFYPLAAETLQFMTNFRPDIKKILWTSSYPEELKLYLKEFSTYGIEFEHVNENPGISSNNGNFGFYEKKFYFNVLLDDKAGFNPEKEWEQILKYLIDCEEDGYLPHSDWTTKK